MKNLQSIDDIEKHRHHLHTVGNFEEIEATIDFGAACCLLLRDLCNDVETLCIDDHQTNPEDFDVVGYLAAMCVRTDGLKCVCLVSISECW